MKDRPQAGVNRVWTTTCDLRPVARDIREEKYELEDSPAGGARRQCARHGRRSRDGSSGRPEGQGTGQTGRQTGRQTAETRGPRASKGAATGRPAAAR